MKKSLLLSVVMLIVTAFAFMSPASAADLPAGYDISVGEHASAMPNAEPLPAINVAEDSCSGCILAAAASPIYLKPATFVTPGGASPGIAIALNYIGPDNDDDSDPDIRV